MALAACGDDSSSDVAYSAGAVSGSSTSKSGTATSGTAAGVPATDPLLFSSASYSIAQNAGSVSLTVLRVGSASAAVSVDYSTVDGTALAGTDYSATKGTLQWAAADSSSKTIVVPVSNVAPFAGNRSFSVALENPGATAQIASPDTAVVTISGTAVAAAGTLQFSSSNYSVSQSARQLSVTVTRTTASNGAISVNYATSDGTALAGTDYTATTGTLNWADGDAASKTFLVPISNAKAFSGVKSFGISLSSPAAGSMLGSISTATATISGAGTASAGTLHLSSANYSVDQSAGTVTIVVDRTGGTNGDVSVAYATAGGTAIAGTDYTSASGSLTWADGDGSAKSFTCAISNAAAFSGSKSFTVALSMPGNGATFSNPSTATVTITGDGTPAVGVIQLGAASYTVAQSAGNISVNVNRTAGSAGAVSVAYATVDGTAKSGTDYTATAGTLQWADGDATTKKIPIAISNATPFSGSKAFSIAISNAVGGDVGTPASASVLINGSAASSAPVSSGPSAPSGLTMVKQGANSISLVWSAATPGGSPIAHYKIYRNGAAYDTSNSTSYTDNGATNATNSAFVAPAAIYSYAVSAVDGDGNEGTRESQVAFQVYTNGVFNFAGDYSYDATANYKDVQGGPESGPYDIAINVWLAYGGFQPYAGNVVPQWDLEIGSFGYFSIDLKPTIKNQLWRLSMISRLPPGDVYPWSTVNVTDYGPAPVVGKWATYKIPLSALTIGTTHFEGSISGTTLTVTNIDSGVGVDAGGFITGSGVKPGTYILGHNAQGGVGTYTIYPSQNVPATSMTEQRTSLYKPNLQDMSGASSNNFYIDNMKFTTQ